MQTAKRAYFLVITLACLATGSIAQSRNEVNKLSAELDAINASSFAAVKNLADMSRAASSADANLSLEVARGFQDVRKDVLYANTMAVTHALMVDQRDANVIAGFWRLACKSLLASTTFATRVANEAAMKIAAPALIQEVTRARDLLAQIGESQSCKNVPAFEN